MQGLPNAGSVQESWRLHGASTEVDLMGLLDDLAMGFGLKERTEDYDARTARNIALTQRYGDDEVAKSRAMQSGGGYITTSYDPRATAIGPNDQGRMQYQYQYDTSTGPAQQFLSSRGRDNYNPQIADDNRPFMQRLLFSPASDPSPTPYAIGPLTMDQPLPKFGLLGLLSGLGGMFGRDVPTVSADASPMRVRPVSGYNLGGSGQTGTRFDTRTEAKPIDYSDGIPVQDPATIAATEALANLSDMPTSYVPAVPSAPASPPEIDINFLENTRVPRAIDLERPLPVMPIDPTYYSGIDVDVPMMPSPDVIQLPNGLYANRRTGEVFR